MCYVDTEIKLKIYDEDLYIQQKMFDEPTGIMNITIGVFAFIYAVSLVRIWYCLYYMEEWRVMALKVNKLTKELSETKKKRDMYKKAWESKTQELEQERNLIETKEANIWEQKFMIEEEYENVLERVSFGMNEEKQTLEHHAKHMEEELTKLQIESNLFQNLVDDIRCVLQDEERVARKITQIKKILANYDNNTTYVDDRNDDSNDDDGRDPDWRMLKT